MALSIGFVDGLPFLEQRSQGLEAYVRVAPEPGEFCGAIAGRQPLHLAVHDADLIHA